MTGSKIGDAVNGEDTSIDGTEKLPVTGSKFTTPSRIAEYIRTLTQTLTGKTINLTDNTLTGTKAQFNTAMSDADFATLTGSETLTNKTLTSPIVATISNTGTLTLPTSTDTMVGRATTDTLTNKTLTAPTVADFTNAAHDHGDADDGGSLAASITITTPTIASFTNAQHNHSDAAGGGLVGNGAFVLNVNTTPVGNITTGEDDLITYAVPANTLDTNSQYIHFKMAGIFASSINAKRIKVKFGSTTLFDTGALAITAAGDWSLEGHIVRTGSATQRCWVEFESNETALAGSADYVDATEDLTAGLTLKATGEATSTDDIIQKVLIAEKGGGAASGGGGGRTLIAEVTPTGVGTVTVASSISGSYKKLTIEFAIRGTQAANAVDGYLQFNTDTTAGNYQYQESHRNTLGTSSASGASYIFALTGISANSAPANGFSVGVIQIPQYANANIRKQALISLSMEYDASSVYTQMINETLRWANAAAITQIDIALSAGNFASNSVIRLYGES